MTELQGWQRPETREKAQETLRQKMEDGYRLIRNTGVKQVDETWESIHMRNVKYD